MAANKLEKATWVDIALSLILPFWGLVVGCIALFKGENKRGVTMIAISGVLLAAWCLFTVSRP